MNNPYQNRPPLMLNPGQLPQQYEQRGPLILKGAPQQKSNPLYHYPQMNIQNKPIRPINPQGQILHQYASSGNQQVHPAQFQQANQMYIPAPHPQGTQYGLIPPPQLRKQQEHDDTIDQQKVSNIVKKSNENQNLNENEIQVRDILWGEQEQSIAFWEQKFFMIYEKFEWFGSRFQMLKSEYISLSEQLLSVDSEDDWNELKLQHQEFAEKLQEMFQELIAVADENQQLINQRLEQDDGVWEKRYHELLSNFKALQEKTSMLEVEKQELKTYQQNDTQQQQGNYPELLSHYRNLEEEYEKLYTAYNKLQEEYENLKASPNTGKEPLLEDFDNMRMEYQRTLQAIQAENDQLKTDCQGLYDENQHLKEQLKIYSQSYGETEQLAKTLHEKEQITIDLNTQLQEWKRKYEHLENQLSELVQRQSTKAQEIIIQLENQLSAAKQQIITKESQYVIISKKLQDELINRESLISNHHEELSKAVKLESDKHLRLRQGLQKQIRALHEEYEALMKESSQREINKYKMEAQEKRLGLMREENERLLDEIRGKNVELSGLRNVSLELASYENIFDQYKSLEREKLGLEEVSRRERSELLELKKRVRERQEELQQVKSSGQWLNKKSGLALEVKHLQEQLSQQKQQSSRSQSQANKYKQVLEAKEKYISQLQEQKRKERMKIEEQSRVIQKLEQEHRGEVEVLERKVETLEKRQRASEVEFRTEIVDNYDREIKELRQGNQQKLNRIKKLESTLSQLTSTKNHLQKSTSALDTQSALLQTKLYSLQTTNAELLSKLTLSHQSINTLQQQLSSYKLLQTALKTQLNTCALQLQQAHNLINSKNLVIASLEAQIKQFVDKVSKLQLTIRNQNQLKLSKFQTYQQRVNELQAKLYSPNHLPSNSTFSNPTHHRYTSSYSNRYFSFGPKHPQNQHQNQHITKIQTSIIEQFQSENSQLKQQILQLTKKIHSLQSLSRIVPDNLQNSPTISLHKTKLSLHNDNYQPAQKDLPPINNFLQERLLKFNQRLQHCIHDNNLIAIKNVDLTASQRITNHQKQKRQMENAFQKQIKAFKDQITLLQQQLANQPAPAQPHTQIMDSDIKDFDKHQIMNEHIEKNTAESIEFLRNKLNQQEKTNSILIKLNEQIKKQLEESFQKSSHLTSEYYKLQWKESEKIMEQEKQKNKKLSEQNKRLSRENLENDTKLMKEYELKIFKIELKLKQVEQENSYLKLLKAKADNEKANLMHDVNVYSADIETIKSSSEIKVLQYEKLANELREKCSVLQRDLHQAMNGVKLTSQKSSSKLSSGEKRSVIA